MAIEALAAERRALKLPVTCVGWGRIADAGYLARNERILKALVGRIGGAPLTSDDALLGLESLLGSSAGNVAAARSRLGSARPLLTGVGGAEILGSGALGRRRARCPRHESAQELRRRLDSLSGSALVAALTEIVRSEAAEILRIAPERIESGMSLLEMGMDSLMAVELATSLEGRLDVQLSALALSGGPTIKTSSKRVQRLLRPQDPAAEGAANGTLAAQVLVVAAQHIADLGAENAAQLSAEISAGINDASAAPLSLTAGQRPWRAPQGAARTHGVAQRSAHPRGVAAAHA